MPQTKPSEDSRSNSRLPSTELCPPAACHCSKLLEFIISNTQSPSFQEAGRWEVLALENLERHGGRGGRSKDDEPGGGCARLKVHGACERSELRKALGASGLWEVAWNEGARLDGKLVQTHGHGRCLLLSMAETAGDSGQRSGRASVLPGPPWHSGPPPLRLPTGFQWICLPLTGSSLRAGHVCSITSLRSQRPAQTWHHG